MSKLRCCFESVNSGRAPTGSIFTNYSTTYLSMAVVITVAPSQLGQLNLLSSLD